jgi:hypothetical protein
MAVNVVPAATKEVRIVVMKALLKEDQQLFDAFKSMTSYHDSITKNPRKNCIPHTHPPTLSTNK